MAVSLTHSKVSSVPDGADSSLVRPSDWNAEHVLTQATGNLLGRTTAGTGATEEIAPSAELTLSAGTLGIASSIGGKTLTGPTVVNVNSSSDALRITQTGAGNAFVVEDDTNPDASPFQINATGQVSIGTTTAAGRLNIYDAATAQVLISGDATTAIALTRYSSDVSQANINQRKARGTLAAPAAVNSGDGVGTFAFNAYGGSNFRQVGLFTAAVETYTSDTNISGFLAFSTNPGGTTVSERVRITAAGNVGIGTTTPAVKLAVSSTDAVLVPVGTTAERPTPATGYFRFNSTLSQFEGYNGTAWGAIGGGGVTTSDTPPGSPADGDLWWDSADGQMYVYYDDGTSSQWVVANSFAGSTAYLPLSGGTVTGAVAFPAGSASTPSVIPAGDTNTGIFFPAADTIAFAEGGVEVMRIDSSGNVGIGTAAASGKFEVLHGVDGDDLITATTATGSGQIRLRPDGTNGNTIRYGGSGAANGVLRFVAPGNVERARLDASGNLQFNSGYGSVAIAYGCRAWVNFNGTGTVAIRASGNVTSITDNGGTGDYTVNFTTAMPDTNYAVAGFAWSGNSQTNNGYLTGKIGTSPAAGSVRINACNGINAQNYDPDWATITVVR